MIEFLTSDWLGTAVMLCGVLLVLGVFAERGDRGLSDELIDPRIVRIPDGAPAGVPSVLLPDEIGKELPVRHESEGLTLFRTRGLHRQTFPLPERPKQDPNARPAEQPFRLTFWFCLVKGVVPLT